MASIIVSDKSVTVLKQALHKFYPEFRSSHLSEAIAAALGRKTYASLLVDIKATASDPEISFLDDHLFFSKLEKFGYLYDTEFSFEIMVPDVISTTPSSAYDIEYKSKRDLAWRNLMIIATNQAIRLKLISLRPGDNRWPGADKNEGYVFDFDLPNGMKARGYVHDAGFDELTIHTAVKPRGVWLKAFNASFSAGDAFARGWIERKTGAWLQSATSSFNCKRYVCEYLASLHVVPDGYGDRGRVLL